MRTSSTPPIFIVGAQRSGTTMLRLMLNSHPAIAVPFESDFLRPLQEGSAKARFQTQEELRDAVRALAREKFTSKAGVVAESADLSNRGIGSYAELVDAVFGDFARGRSKLRWGIKTPGYTTQIDLLYQLFPACRIIHLVRDGRDVLLSRRQIKWGGKNTLKIANDWRWQVLIGRKLGGMTGGQYLEVRYEDLVADTEPVLRQVCAFVGEAFDTSMLQYHENAAGEMPADSLKWHSKSVAAPDASKMFAWKKQLPLTEQLLFQETAGDALREFGYELLPAEGSRLATKLRRAYYALKL